MKKDDSGLAPYAVQPHESRGRLIAEKECTMRTPHQRDRDRIIHSVAFRRLEYKTQVFVNHEGDHYRTRLTHSLEVAQLARGIARSLKLNEDLAEALALAHDLGHTPFGHAGEDGLHEAMREFGGFDHNAQTIRILTQLEQRYADFDGLNLTWETLEGVAKHNGPLVGTPTSKPLPRALKQYAEQQDLELHSYASAEAQVAAIADDIAYNNHDLDDGLRAGFFKLDDLLGLPLMGDLIKEVQQTHPMLSSQRQSHEVIRRLINRMVGDVMNTTRLRIQQHRISNSDNVRHLGMQLVGFSKEMDEVNRSIKSYLFKHMYRHFKVNRMSSKAKRVIKEMFEFFHAEPNCLPTVWYAQTDGARTHRTAEIVADFIAGMTDRFALEEHARIFDPRREELMNLFNEYRNAVMTAVTGIFPGTELGKLTLEPPRDASHGDLSTNAAMILAGQTGKKPREIADAIKPALEKLEGVTKVDIAGPGFINITLEPAIWRKVLPVILSDANYGRSTIGRDAGKVNVEYVSANPTGPLHVGHTRGAVYGDALATLLKYAGYDVTKEYYTNDAGAQIEVLTRSVHLRYREACGETIGEIPAGLYPGEYLVEVGQKIKAELGEGVAENDPRIKQIAIDSMMALIKHDLADLGIHHDVFTSEQSLHDRQMIQQSVKVLTEKGHLYNGVLEPPKGKKADDWEAKEQLLFRSTAFGDDMDRTIAKSDGNFTYFAGDLGLTLDKIQRGFTTMIYMFGADHGGYVKRIEAMTAALSDKKASVDIKLCQLVHLFKNGEPVRMSKRAGNFVTARDVLDEVGKDILRFVMLMRKTDQDMEFDFDKVKEQSKENPVFYVQYAYARCRSLLRMAATEAPDALNEKPNFDLLTHPAELTLIKELAAWPRQVEQAALAHEPHRIIYYLQEVAGAFHALWNVGSSDAQIRFILADQKALTAARLGLARAVTSVVASGLAVCGVTPVEELR